MSMNKVISVSGVHGVGKSTIINRISSIYNLIPSIPRPQNPFTTPYEAMLFFIAAFSWRDNSIREQNRNALIDRWSICDISIYVDSLHIMEKISKHQHRALLGALGQSESHLLVPNVAILLDDAPSSILKHIESFAPSIHHILERDIQFISILRDGFIRRFKELDRSQSDPKIMIIEVNGKGIDDVCTEVAEKIEDWLSLNELHMLIGNP